MITHGYFYIVSAVVDYHTYSMSIEHFPDRAKAENEYKRREKLLKSQLEKMKGSKDFKDLEPEIKRKNYLALIQCENKPDFDLHCTSITKENILNEIIYNFNKEKLYKNE